MDDRGKYIFTIWKCINKEQDKWLMCVTKLSYNAAPKFIQYFRCFFGETFLQRLHIHMAQFSGSVINVFACSAIYYRWQCTGWPLRGTDAIAKYYNQEWNYKNTIQYNTVQCSAVQCNAMQCNAMQIKAKQYNTIQCNTNQYKSIQINTLQYNALHYNTVQYNTIQCNAMQCNALQYNKLYFYSVTINRTFIECEFISEMCLGHIFPHA